MQNPKVMSTPAGLDALGEVANEMYCGENVDFLRAFFALRASEPSFEGVKAVLENFFSEKAEQPLNVESGTRVAMEKLFARIENHTLAPEECTCELLLLPFQEVR